MMIIMNLMWYTNGCPVLFTFFRVKNIIKKHFCFCLPGVLVT